MTGQVPTEAVVPVEACWRSLAERSPFYIAVFSREGRLTFLNRAPGGGDPGTFLGAQIGELIPLGDGPDLARALERVVQEDRPQRVEIPAGIADRTIWIELCLLPLRDGLRVSGVLAVGIDATDSKRAGLELRMSVNALHRAIESREQLEADLHDGILQSLYGVGLRLEAARGALGAQGGDVAVHLSRAVEQIRTTMSEIRRSLAEGRGALPPSEQWEETLTGLLRGLEVEGGPAIDLALDRHAASRVRAPEQSELAFIAREAVANAVRHAGASRIVVRLVDVGPRVRLEVEDNGRGLAPLPNAGGFGLLTMTRRAAQIHALLAIQSAPGGGTVVRVDLSPSAEALAPHA